MEDPFPHCDFCHGLSPAAEPEQGPQGYILGSTTDLRVVSSRAVDGCRSCVIVEQALTSLDPMWRERGDGECRGRAVHGWVGGECSCHKFTLYALGQSVALCYPTCGDFMEDLTGSNGQTLELFVSEGKALEWSEIDTERYTRAAGGLKPRLQPFIECIDQCRENHTCDGTHDFFCRSHRREGSQEPLDGESDGSVDQEVEVEKEKEGETFSTESHQSMPNPDATLHREEAVELPKRVLDLRTFSTDGKLRLLETDGLLGVYACLSYCWGGPNPCTTTMGTLDTFTADIPWNLLPQTYRDAIHVAATLCLPFLWIDALCIVQGEAGHGDWLEQSARMANIYGNARIVIAAANSATVTEGFLRPPRPVSDVVSFTARLGGQESGDRGEEGDEQETEGQASVPVTPVTVYARRMLNHLWLAAKTWDNRARLARTPFWNRAWCFQEEILASRILVFHEEDIFFACRRESYACECGYHYEPPENYSIVTPMKSEFQEPFLEDQVDGKCNEYWDRFALNHSRRQLTVATDRLPSLSGIARIAQRVWGRRYLAGHWEDESFLFSLCWSPERDNPMSTPHPGIYVAPSWSWVAYGGSLTRNNPLYDSWDLVKGTELLSADIQLASDDPTGAVAAGHFRVRGVFMDVECTADENKRYMQRNGQKLDYSLDHVPAIVAEDAKLVCWWVATSLNASEEDPSAWNGNFLLILRAKEDSELDAPVYERVGHSEWWVQSDGPEIAFVEGWSESLKIATIV